MSLSAQAAADIVSGTTLGDAEHLCPPGWVDMVLPAGSVQEIQPANLHQPAAEGQHQQGPSALHTSGESLATHPSTFTQLPGSPQFISCTAATTMLTVQPPYQDVGSRQHHASTFSSKQGACLQQPISSDGKRLHHRHAHTQQCCLGDGFLDICTVSTMSERAPHLCCSRYTSGSQQQETSDPPRLRQSIRRTQHEKPNLQKYRILSKIQSFRGGEPKLQVTRTGLGRLQACVEISWPGLRTTT